MVNVNIYTHTPDVPNIQHIYLFIIKQHTSTHHIYTENVYLC